MKTSLFLLLAFVAPLSAQAPVLPHLGEYVAKDDGNYRWKLVDSTKAGENSITNLKLTSQTWQGETWEHDVQIFVPKGVKPGATVVLYNTGGGPNPAISTFGLAIAERAQAPVAFLFQIPKQPLYGKREDALIAETFVKYLETKDPSWPLLFPMVKSVVKCMDAVQAFAKQEWKTDVTGFIVCGASKRGWTTWLTAATGDKRVKAIAPMVFDSLNLREQMPNQIKSFGKFSAMIKDYEDRRLLPLPDTDEAKQLWAMVDPWVYCEKITIPKLIINGTNDPYWAQDSLNFYWKDLKGPKSVIYVPNAGHDLRAMEDPSATKPNKDRFPMKAVDTLSAFCRGVCADEKFPMLDAKVDEASGNKLKVSFSAVPKSYRVWSATSDSRDFRKSKWTAGDVRTTTNIENATVSRKADKPFEAFFVEAEYENKGLKYCVSSPIRILEKK